MKELIKLLSKETNDLLIEYWIDKASNTIKEYLRCEYTLEEIQTKYKDAVIQLVVDEFKKVDKDRKYANVVQVGQGARSMQFNVESVVTGRITLTSEVKALLPKPRLRCY